MKKAGLVFSIATIAACGDATAQRVRQEREVCGAVADHLQRRIDAHKAELQRMSATAERKQAGLAISESDRAAFERSAADVHATHRVAWRLASRCIGAFKDKFACATKPSIDIGAPDSISDFSHHLTALHEGMLGRGRCAAPDRELADSSPSDICVDAMVHLSTDDSDIKLVQDSRFPSRLAEWRAEIDYTLALAPRCIDAKRRDGCLQLAERLGDASIDRLIAVRRQLHAALLERTPCDAAALPPR